MTALTRWDSVSRRMPLTILIDGYNVLGACGKRRPERTIEGGEAREALIARLSLYSQRKGHRVTVVFDAWREPTGFEHHEHRSGVQVVFTKRGERADQVIQRLAREYGRACAVVSSDLEIIQTAKSYGAFVMKSQEFQVKLESLGDAKSHAGEIVSPVQPWAKPEEEIPPARLDKKGNPRKLPKAVRNRKRQLREF